MSLGPEKKEEAAVPAEVSGLPQEDSQGFHIMDLKFRWLITGNQRIEHRTRKRKKHLCSCFCEVNLLRDALCVSLLIYQAQ